MGTTWGEIKLATLQKMFAADGSNLVEDESTKDYLAAMPHACNEGLQLLSTAGKFIVKSLVLAHNPIANMLPDSESKKMYQLVRGTKEFSTDGGHSWFFECMGIGKADIYLGSDLIDTVELNSKQAYKEYRGIVDNALDKSVRIVFTCSYPIAIKNVAIYDAAFESVDDVPTFAEKVRYKLTDYAKDFYMLDSEEIYYEGDSDTGRYIRTSNFFQEGDTVLVLDRNTPGNYTIYYKAYPEKITTATENSYELPIDDEVAVLLPLYMASQLYLDDDTTISQTYKAQFDLAFGMLANKPSTPSAETFTSESGWI